MVNDLKLQILSSLVTLLLLAGCGKFTDNMFNFNVSEDGCNFVTNSKGQRVSWRQLPVRLYLHANVPNDLAKSFIEATEIWNEAFKSQVGLKGNFFHVDSTRIKNIPQKDKISVVYMESNWPKEAQDKQAITSIHWMGKRIGEADIVFNTSPGKGYELSANRVTETGKLDFLSLAIHELGHVAGLGHINLRNNTQGTVMAERLAKGQMRRSPNPEIDLVSLKCEY